MGCPAGLAALVPERPFYLEEPKVVLYFLEWTLCLRFYAMLSWGGSCWPMFVG